MQIKYALYKANLPTASESYVARVQSVGTLEIDDLIERMDQHGSTVVKADIVSVLEEFFSTIEQAVVEGYNVNTPVTNFGASIQGTFDGQSDSFDPERHRILASTSPGARLRNAVKNHARASKQEAGKRQPNVLEYTDTNSSTRNSTLTPGGMGQLVGRRLKFDLADPNQGVFFVAEDATATRVTVVSRNKPAELIFLVPDTLLPASYAVEVRSILSGTTGVRRGALDDVVLTVENGSG